VVAASMPAAMPLHSQRWRIQCLKTNGSTMRIATRRRVLNSSVIAASGGANARSAGSIRRDGHAEPAGRTDVLAILRKGPRRYEAIPADLVPLRLRGGPSGHARVRKRPRTRRRDEHAKRNHASLRCEWPMRASYLPNLDFATESRTHTRAPAHRRRLIDWKRVVLQDLLPASSEAANRQSLRKPMGESQDARSRGRPRSYMNLTLRTKKTTPDRQM